MSAAGPDERPAARMPGILVRTPPAVYLAVVLSVVVVMAATALQPWLPVSDLLRDSQVVAARHAGGSPAYGLVSNVGILVMVLAAGGAAIGWLVLRDAPAPWPRLLLWAGLLTLVLAVDDLIMLHEAAAFAPWSGVLIAAVYGLAVLRFVVRFRDEILRDLDPGLLLLAVGSLGVSLVTDLIDPTPASLLVEDGAKLLGLVSWSAFVVRSILRAFASSRAGAVDDAVASAPAQPARNTAHRDLDRLI